MQKLQQFFGRLLGTRPTWPYDMTPNEEKIMAEHAVHLKKLIMQKKFLMAGPCFGNPVFGLAVLQALDQAEASALMADDPAVKAGLMTFDVAPLRVSFMSDNRPACRYAEERSDRILHKEITVPGKTGNVWEAWTTTEGTQTFLSPETHIDLRPGGAYEIYFNLSAPHGQRGSEDCKILSYLPYRMLSFEWNAPPQFGELRDVRTIVVMLFEPLGDNETRILFDHLGWDTGEDWDRLYQYFDRAWDAVLSNCWKRFAEGPLNWSR